MTTTDQSPDIPREIAEAVMWPESYVQLEQVVHPACAWLREHCPVGRADIDGWDPVWVVSRHADVAEVARDEDLFWHGKVPHLASQATLAFNAQLPQTRSLDYPTFMDPPEHPKVRKSVMGHFQPASVRRHYEERARRLAKEAVDELMDFDGECDFLQDFAIHYPLRLILSVLGIDDSEAPRMLTLTREFFGLHDPANRRPEFRDLPDGAARQYAATIKDLLDYFADLRAERAAQPADDLVTVVNRLTIDGAPWPDGYANSFLAGVAPSGHDTTSATVAGGMLGLIRHPDQLAMVRDDPGLIGGLVEESLRYATPAKTFMRHPVRDTEVAGVAIRAGEPVLILYVSANRDERVFDDPDAFDVTRRPNPHLSFGLGPHLCTGIHLAKLEMRILWEELLPRLRTVALAGDVEYQQANLVCGLTSLPIRFTKA